MNAVTRATLMIAAPLVFALCAEIAHAADPTSVAGLQAGFVYGSAREPFPLAELHRTQGLLGVFHAGASVKMHHELKLEFRGAVVGGEVRLPAGGALQATTWANPELAVLWHRAYDKNVQVNARLGLALPFGNGSSDPRESLVDNRALLLANALTGELAAGLFAPGRLTTTPALAVKWRGDPVFVHAFGAAPLSVAAKSSIDASVEINPVAVTLIAGGGASARVIGGTWFAIDSWMVLKPVTPAYAVGRDDQQLMSGVVAPRLAVGIGAAAIVSLFSNVQIRRSIGLERLSLGVDGALRF